MMVLKNLSNQDWIKYQFENNLNNTLRNVLLHISFIEGFLIDKSEEIKKFGDYEKEKCERCNPKFRTIFKAISILENEKLLDCVYMYKSLFWIRNDLIHGIARKKTAFSQNDIDGKRDNAHKILIKIYKNSSFLSHLFEERNFKFKPSDYASINQEYSYQDYKSSDT